MVSHMTYVTGLVTPVKELADLAHRRGLLISVDGAHPLGMMDLDLKAMNVDHYAAAGQKWLMCGTGTGVCYIKRDIQDRIWPLMGPPGEPKDGAKRYEAFGQRDVPSVLGMSAAVDAAERDRQDERRGPRPHAQHAVPNRAQGHSGREAVDVGRSALRGGPDAVQRARHADGQRAEGDPGNRDRIYIRTMTTGNLNGVPRGDAHLQHAGRSRSADRQREARLRECQPLHDDRGAVAS